MDSLVYCCGKFLIKVNDYYFYFIWWTTNTKKFDRLLGNDAPPVFGVKWQNFVQKSGDIGKYL